MKKVLSFLSLFFLFQQGYSQYYLGQNKVWTFGSRAGVNFSSGSPVAFSSSISTSEGCASVADAAGNLQFYTDGRNVYNRTGGLMPSGAGIVSFTTASSTQGSLIVPDAGNANLYYLFSLEDVSGSSGYCHLNYCKVDMSLAGGNGDVVASTIGTVLEANLAEKMIAIPGSNCNIWLLLHRRDSTKFLAYSITASGITGPVVSTAGTFSGGAYGGYGIGVMKASPDRTKVVTQTYNISSPYGTELSDFDPATGIVSNCRVLDVNNQYGGEFSPNSLRLYTHQSTGAPGVYQYDLSLATTSAIIASKTLVASGSGYPDLKLGPDSKIYFPGLSSATTQLDCIPSPDVVGTGCGYTAGAVSLVGGTYANLGMPNMVVVGGTGGDTVIKHFDTLVCMTSAGINLHADTTGSYYWDNGSNAPTRNVTAAGTYWLAVNNGCRVNMDTFIVRVVPYIHTETVKDTSFCFPGQITLAASVPNNSYKWQDGSGNISFDVTGPGTYYVTGFSYCTDHSDTFHVSNTSLTFSLGMDTTVCMNYLIKAPLKGSEYSYRWQDGSTDSIFSASHTASYVLYITKGNCTATDTINVNFFQIKSNMPDTFICKGMPIDVQLSVNVPQGGTVLWNDGITNPVRTVHDSGTWWVYISKDECMALDTVRVITGYCDCWYNVPGGFTPNGDGLNDVFKPTIEPGCTISGYQFSVYNRWGEELYTSDFRGKGWDGTYKGEPVDLGVYMYSVQFFIGVHDKPVLKTGAVTLIR